MSSSRESEVTEPTSAKRDNRFIWLWPVEAGAVAGIALRLVFSGHAGGPYNAMESSFTLLVPLVVGAVTVAWAERTMRRSWRYYFWAAASANALFVLGTLVIMIEGLVCAVLAVPLFAVLGGVAGILTGALCRWTQWPRHTVYGIAALPLVFGTFEQRLPLPSTILTTDSTRMVAASRDEVWQRLLSAKQIRRTEIGDAWMYRIGVPLPESAASERRDGELVRHIVMGNGIHFDQVASVWEPGRRVLWTYRFCEDSFRPHALDDHVRIGGRHFDVLDTEYALSESAGGTLLRVRMRYRVSTNFNWYVRPIAQFLVRNFEETALAFYAHRAESGEPNAVSRE
jgi:hypothetical protein